MLPLLKEKYDFKKALKAIFNPPKGEPELVEVPPMNFLAIDGAGGPNGNPAFEAATAALYGCAYAIKFSRKKAGIGPEFGVQPLEGLWWVASGDPSQYLTVPLDEWRWRLLIGLPDFIKPQELEEAKAELLKKKGRDASAVRLERFDEGLCVQTLYVGPYKDEHPTIRRMHDWATGRGLRLHGLHHEIYLGDPRKSAPEKLKTILRQPVKRA